MSPRRMFAAEVEQFVVERVTKALAYDHAARENAGGPVGGATERGCTYKKFLGCNPTNFKGTEGVKNPSRYFLYNLI